MGDPRGHEIDGVGDQISRPGIDARPQEPDREGHDTLRVAAASARAAANHIRLDIEDMRPADTIRIHFSLKSANKSKFSETAYLTVHQLPD